MTGSTRSYEMAKRIAAAGHDVHVITSSREGNTPHGRWVISEIEGFKVHWVSINYSNEMSYAARIRAFLKFAIAATRRAIQQKADLVFATSTPLTIAIPALITKKVCRIPMVFEVRDLWPELPIAIGALRWPPAIWIARWLELRAYKGASQLVGCSPGMCDGIIRRGISADRVHNIPNCCDLSLFKPNGEAGKEFRDRFEWLKNRPLVVYAGTFGVINGVSYLARLAKETIKSNPSVRFLAVGYGYDEGAIREEAQHLGVLNENFFMLPKQQKKNIPPIYNAATVVTSLFLPIPEMQSNSANKFFDGLAAGKPIAINYGGWQAELIDKEKFGVVLDHHDIAGSAQNLVSLLDDSEELHAMGKRARSLAQAKFSRDALAAQLIEVLEQAYGDENSLNRNTLV